MIDLYIHKLRKKTRNKLTNITDLGQLASANGLDMRES